MLELVVVVFDAELWTWDARRADSWTFVSLPADASAEIRDRAAGPRRGFGSLRVRVTVGGSTWTTSIFPDNASGRYVLPIKRQWIDNGSAASRTPTTRSRHRCPVSTSTGSCAGPTGGRRPASSTWAAGRRPGHCRPWPTTPTGTPTAWTSAGMRWTAPRQPPPNGWTPVYAHISDAAEWDNYEWSWVGSLTEWALDNPGHPDAAEARALAREHREQWLRGYRNVLGFATLLLRRT
jgi:hypothetical protein